jgi:hypothetical protein
LFKPWHKTLLLILCYALVTPFTFALTNDTVYAIQCQIRGQERLQDMIFFPFFAGLYYAAIFMLVHLPLSLGVASIFRNQPKKMLVLTATALGVGISLLIWVIVNWQMGGFDQNCVPYFIWDCGLPTQFSISIFVAGILTSLCVGLVLSIRTIAGTPQPRNSP